MTKQEAIETIKLALSQVEWDYPLNYAAAFDMAISAMEKQDAPDINVDTISRQAAIDLFPDDALEWDTKGGYIAPHLARRMIEELPSAQPEPHYDEWCDDCKEYDKERHCCPRWNRVIRQALKDAQPEQRWIPCSESERLPDPYFEVIVSDDEIVYTAIRTDIGLNGMREDHYHFEDIEERRIVHPDAWMPLPEPYRGEGEE